MAVRDTNARARENARARASGPDDYRNEKFFKNALDNTAPSEVRKTGNRLPAEREGYTEQLIRAGIGRARTGCCAALVGAAEHIPDKIEVCRNTVLRSFIFSRCLQPDECDGIGAPELPETRVGQLPHDHGRFPLPAPAAPPGLGESYDGTRGTE